MSTSPYAEIENPERFLPLAQKMVDHARKRGADFADAVLNVDREIEIGVE